MRLLILSLLCAAAGALAFPKGTTLYVRANDTLLQKQPGKKGPAVTKLQAGQAVIWNGLSLKDDRWHEVTVDGKKGFVQLSELRPHARTVEIDGPTAKPMSPETSTETEAAAAAELIYLEEFHKVTATAAALAKKNDELHPR